MNHVYVYIRSRCVLNVVDIPPSVCSHIQRRWFHRLERVKSQEHIGPIETDLAAELTVVWMSGCKNCCGSDPKITVV